MVCFPKRILHNRLLDPSASRWQFCILGCAQVRLNGGCHWDIDNSKSAGCVVSVEATMCMSITTPGKECSQWLILPLEVPSFHPFTDRSYLLSGNSQPALLVRPLSNIAAQLLNWGARLLASGWCLQGQQTHPSVQPVLRTRPLLPVAFFISPCRWTAFPGLALPAPPCPTACLKRYLTLPSCPFGWSAGLNAIDLSGRKWLFLPQRVLCCSDCVAGGGERYGGGVPFFLNCFLALRDGKVLEKFLNSSIHKFRVYWSFRGVSLASD